MTVLGCDFDSRAVHCVLLDDDSNAARYVPVPIADVSSTFTVARNVRPALRKAIRHESAREGIFTDGWDQILAVGIEKPFTRNRAIAYGYGLVTGAILAALPRDVELYMVPPNHKADTGGWKALAVGRTNASKDEVREWAIVELLAAGSWPLFADAPQDAFDAYCIARAVRALNERAIGDAA